MGVLLAILLAASSTCPHLRANGDPAVASLIEEASRTSATFRQLVSALDRTNGLVYVEPGQCRHGVHECLTLSIKVAGPHRILRILLDLHRELAELIGALGHELQHALEVLSNIHLTTTESAYLFYMQIGPTANGRFETEGAIRTGLQVEHEVLASRASKGRP
jgi:hypothetical protein